MVQKVDKTLCPLEFCLDVARSKDTHVLIPSVFQGPGGPGGVHSTGRMQVWHQSSLEGGTPALKDRRVGRRSRQGHTVAGLGHAFPSGEHMR